MSAIIHSFHIRTFWSEAFSIDFINIESDNQLDFVREIVYFGERFFTILSSFHYPLEQLISNLILWSIETWLNIFIQLKCHWIFENLTHSLFIEMHYTHTLNFNFYFVVVVIDSFQTKKGIQFYELKCNMTLHIKQRPHKHLTISMIFNFIIYSIINYVIEDISECLSWCKNIFYQNV